jgi:dipeptidyl-peptidase-4
MVNKDLNLEEEMKNSLLKCLGLSFIAILFVSISVMGQGTLKQPTLDNLIPGGDSYLYSPSLYNLQWWGDVCVEPSMNELTAINPKDGSKTILTTLSEVNAVLMKANLGKLTSFYYVKMPWKNRPVITFSLHRVQIEYNFKEKTIERTSSYETEMNNVDFAYQSGNVAYTVKNNLYVNGTAVTNEPDGIVCGQSVHRNEFGITKGTFWSPSGKLLAFYRMDESMVGQYPLVNTEEREGKVEFIRYPMAGMTSHKVTVGIYNPETKQTIYLKAGDPTDRYFTNISWSPDEKYIYLIELNRDQNHSKLCRYDAQSGELLKVLVEETNPKYVEPLHPITFLPWDDNKFIYQSQRDGFNHLYLYNTDGKLLSQITKGSDWLIQELIGFNAKKKSVIVKAGLGLNSNLYSIGVSSHKVTLISSNGVKDAVHDGMLSESGQYIIDMYSAPNLEKSINIVDVSTCKNRNLLKAEDPYKGYEMPEISVGTIKAADGVTDLYYRLTKPSNLDPNKKYPVVIYVYGGPHAQMVNNGWLNGSRGWDIYMANKGYIVFTLDNRGSENRGFDFESVTFRHLGIEESKDQVKGVEFLKSLPYVDANRIGVHGWSFGGHMTVGLMLRHPDLFKVGVAGGPVIDWKYYEVMYGERYMDTPQTNPDGYKECDLKNYAGNLKGHLLIIHDDHDDTCVPQHSITFLKACVEARTYPDFFTYPGHKHNVIGRERVHLHEKITRYFDDYLK